MPEVAEELGLHESTAWHRYRAAHRSLQMIVERWRAQQRGRGRDDVLAVLLPFLRVADVQDRAPPSPPGRLTWSARVGRMAAIRGTALVLSLGSLVPVDAASPQLAPVAEVSTDDAGTLEPVAMADLRGDDIPALGLTDAPPDLALPSLSGASSLLPERSTPPTPPMSHVLEPEESLRAEEALVEHAASLVGTRYSAHARALLSRHAREFPRGRFAARRDQLILELNRIHPRDRF